MKNGITGTLMSGVRKCSGTVTGVRLVGAAGQTGPGVRDHDQCRAPGVVRPGHQRTHAGTGRTRHVERTDVGRQVDLLRRAAEIDVLLDDLVRAVLARGFDAHRVLARLHQLAGVVLAIPLQRVLARRTCGARHRRRDVVLTLDFHRWEEILAQAEGPPAARPTLARPSRRRAGRRRERQAGT